MALVLVIRSGADGDTLRLGFENVGIRGASLMQIAGGNSVGADGVFDVADGSGGWRESEFLRETGLPGAKTLEADYQAVVLRALPGFRIDLGDPTQNTLRPSFISLNTRGTISFLNISGTMGLMNATTFASVLAGRSLAWDGSQNVYLDPPQALYGGLFIAANRVLTTNEVAAQHLTVFCALGGLLVTLPDVTTLPTACRVTVIDRDKNAGASPITVDSNGGQVDGGPNYSINQNGQSVTFIGDASNWYIEGNSVP